MDCVGRRQAVTVTSCHVLGRGVVFLGPSDSMYNGCDCAAGRGVESLKVRYNLDNASVGAAMFVNPRERVVRPGQ